MSLFPSAEGLRDATIEAARQLGLFAALPAPLSALARTLGVPPSKRFTALLDALIALDVIAESDGVTTTRIAPPPVLALPRDGWGDLAAVIRTDRPLAAPTGDVAARYHAHLVTAGAAAQREVAARLGATRLVDLGGGAGGYTAAVLAAHAAATATLVDAPAVIELARAALPARVAFVPGDARAIAVAPHEVALLANVLHGHDETSCAALCAAAARAVVPGGTVAIVDFWIDDDRRGPVTAAMFALSMALYTDGGAVYPSAQIAAWLTAAGLVDVQAVRLSDAPEMMLLTAQRPLDLGVSYGRPLRSVLGRALALAAVEDTPQRAADLRRHYAEAMPQQRRAQLATDVLQLPLDWTRLPRLSRAIDRIFALVAEAHASPLRALGAPTAAAWRAGATTVAALYARTHYGAVMPLLYGADADLAYFRTHGLDPHALVDRYLTTPLVHEICHFSAERDALMPLHLDESVAGWFGVHAHPEFAYPVGDHDDAIFAAPWLAQIGQAIARAFGTRAVIRAHAASESWESALSSSFVIAAARLGWADWRARRTLHFLSDMQAPEPWVALALAAGAGHDLRTITLDELAALPLHTLVLPPDDAFDRAIVEDGLRAMCLDTACIAGSFRTRTRLPEAPITISAEPARITTARRGEVDTVAPRYWLPPSVATRLCAAGRREMVLHLRDLAALPAAAEAIMRAQPIAAAGLTLTAVH